ncbi:hypothetical protein C1H46_040412 [Malus baccata]|uniref:Protein BPS1, chloroplastic n=1 Tax=Malus baccata TaxID=106549 RepID=A0A540KIK7_MALBA|nr:hypothetical protein C1H46_040412 [Malus baccata]
MVAFAVSSLKKKILKTPSFSLFDTLRQIGLGWKPPLVTAWIDDNFCDFIVYIWVINNLTTLISKSLLGAPLMILVTRRIHVTRPRRTQSTIKTVHSVNVQPQHNNRRSSNLNGNITDAHVSPSPRTSSGEPITVPHPLVNSSLTFSTKTSKYRVAKAPIFHRNFSISPLNQNSPAVISRMTREADLQPDNSSCLCLPDNMFVEFTFSSAVISRMTIEADIQRDISSCLSLPHFWFWMPFEIDFLYDSCSEYTIMSRPQEPHRPFFHFGNPFKMIAPKGSQLSPRLLGLLNTFEETLAGRLRKLNPKDKDDVLSLSWMKLAMESLCGTHNDIKSLIAEIDLPVSNWDEKWIDVYLDISVKLLDVCIAFSSEISRLNQGHLYLQCVLHNLDSTSSDQFIRARSSLDGWRHHIGSTNPRVENCSTILDKLVESLDLPKVKNSAKGKLLMRAMYGVKVLTVSVCSVFAAAFSGSAKKLLDLNVGETYLWAQAFNDLQGNVNGEIRNVFSSGRVMVLKELEAVDDVVKELYPKIQDGVGLAEGNTYKNSVSDLDRKAQKLSQGLDLLTKEVDGFFQILLAGRDTLLSKLRSGGSVSERMLTGNVEGRLLLPWMITSGKFLTRCDKQETTWRKSWSSWVADAAELQRSFSSPKFSGSDSCSIDENENPFPHIDKGVFLCEAKKGNLGCGFVGKPIGGWVHGMMEIGEKA